MNKFQGNLDNEVILTHGFIAGLTGAEFSDVVVEIADRPMIAKTLQTMAESVEELADDKTSVFDPFKNKGVKIITNLFSKKILGLYSPAYLNKDRNKLLLVEENIVNVSNQLGFDQEKFFRWVLTHEMFHVAQFNHNDSLLEKELRQRIEDVVKSKDKEKIQEIQAIMTWVEGSADFFMDQEGLLNKEDIQFMRKMVDQRRNKFNFANLLMKLLGNKTGQYLNGKRFADQVSKELGIRAVALPVLKPKLLPTSLEIHSPTEWVDRVHQENSLEK
jgi:uncharacterized protein (DUF2342 family)